MAFRCIKIGSSSLRTQQNKCFTVMQRLLSQFTPSQSSVAFPESIVHLGSGLLKGQRNCLAKAITLIESTRKDHKEMAALLFQYISIHKETKRHHKSFLKSDSFRIGVAGPPGAGKSTFIEAYGLKLIEKNLKVAVIPVDPSSHISGGSILGDKTRMTMLTQSDNAYIRASPTRGVLGGIAEHTSDVISLCEAADFDVVIIESVGLGQSEVEIDMAVDMLLVIVPPGGGDGLQASKKGIMEAADMILINKADGELLSAAMHTKSDYSSAMQFVRRKHYNWQAPVYLISSKTSSGFEKMEESIASYYKAMYESGSLRSKRLIQSTHWTMNQFKRLVIDDACSKIGFESLRDKLLAEVVSGKLSSRQASLLLFEAARNPRE